MRAGGERPLGLRRSRTSRTAGPRMAPGAPEPSRIRAHSPAGKRRTREERRGKRGDREDEQERRRGRGQSRGRAGKQHSNGGGSGPTKSKTPPIL
eukprot:8958084-Pyramimonas_sp.AAC.1